MWPGRIIRIFPDNPSIQFGGIAYHLMQDEENIPGISISGDPRKAIRGYQRAAEQGYAYGQLRLADRYATEKKPEKAIKWYIEVAKQDSQDSIEAQVKLGKLYIDNLGIKSKEKEEEASKLCKKVVQFWKKSQKDRNENRALKWWGKAAEQGNMQAQFNLGLYWSKSIGVGCRQEAMEWLEKAALQGHVRAQRLLGSIYAANKIIVDRNSGKIIEPRIFSLRISTAEMIKDPQGDKKAVKWWKMAAEQKDSVSLFNLGTMYVANRGVEYNFQSINNEIARQLYLQALKDNDVEIQFYVGLFHEKGTVFEQNYNEAKRLYKLAAAQKYPHAQYALGRLYRDGLGVPVNLEKALQYFTLASDQKFADAQYALGKVYEDAIWFKDYEKAKELYQKAAEKGHAQAAFSLGMIYYKKECNCEKNREEAVRWLKIAAEKDYEEAKEVLDAL